MQIKIILFDWGGTLVDVSRQDQALRQAAEQVGILLTDTDRPEPELIEQLVSLASAAEKKAAADPSLREVDLARFIGQWISSKFPDSNPKQLPLILDVIGNTWIGSLDAIPGAIETLEELRNRGYTLGLVSNCMFTPEHAMPELERLRMKPLLHFVVFSSAVGYRKPSPRIYQAALKEAFPLGRPEDLSRVLFVGDSPAFDVIVPAQMGMKTVLVNRPPGFWPAADYAKANPDLRIDAVAELPDLLLG